MKAWSALAVVTCFSLSACGSPDFWMIEASKKAASERLKDPPSARFPVDPFIVRNQRKDGLELVAVCGMIDGKNGFGAYSGGTRFVAWNVVGKNEDSTAPYQVEMDDGDGRATAASQYTEYPTTSFEDVHWNKSCVDAVHPATHTGRQPY